MAHHYIEPLVEIGLTGLEAQAYGYLLENAPATGYGVAKGLGKPTANTYKAMESLFEQGAVIREESGNREYRPVSPTELLDGLERKFVARKERAATELRKLGTTAQDDRVYRLQTPEQVLERMRQMLQGASHYAILDLFPWAAQALAEEIEAAAARGVSVAAKLYEPFLLEGVRVVVDLSAKRVLQRWPGQWANGVVDGQQHLMAWLSIDGTEVHQAIWSGSPFLSWVYHTTLTNELLCTVIESAIQDGKGSAELTTEIAAFRKVIQADNAPGYQALRERMEQQP